MRELAAASFVLLASLALVHYFSYRLYRRRAFLFFCFGWLLNALYILAEGALRLRPGITCSPPDPPAHYLVCYLVSIPSTVCFLAALSDLRHPADANALLRKPWTAFGVVAVATSAVAGEILRGHVRPTIAFFATTTPGVVCTAVVLGFLARHFMLLPDSGMLDLVRTPTSSVAHTPRLPHLPRSRVPRTDEIAPEIRRLLTRSRFFLTASFGAYAVLQLVYLIAACWDSLFWIALAIKVGHLIAALSLILAEFRDTTAFVQTKEVAMELGFLTASVEHDVRSPLSTLFNRIETIRRRTKSGSSLLDDLKFLDKQLARIRAAVDLVPTVRETADYYKNRMNVENLVDIMRTTVKALTVEYPNRQFRIRVDAPKSSLVHVRGYRDRLIQAFINILRNSIEALVDGATSDRQLIVARCSEDPNTGEPVLSVHDQGCGIPANAIDKVTQPWYSTKDPLQKANRGVGMFIANRIIENHGGSMSVESDGASWTIVSIRFPPVAGWATRNSDRPESAGESPAMTKGQKA